MESSSTDSCATVRELRHIRVNANVLDQDCLVECTIIRSIDCKYLQETRELAIENIIAKSTGQTILPNMLDFAQSKQLLSDASLAVKEL